jgi:hypothetical protein
VSDGRSEADMSAGSYEVKRDSDGRDSDGRADWRPSRWGVRDERRKIQSLFSGTIQALLSLYSIDDSVSQRAVGIRIG